MLRLDDIGLALGSFHLRGIHLHIRAGEYLVLLGPTGAGKTVLLETIAGLYAPDQGRILLHGRDITRTAPEKRHLGIVYQDYALFPHFTVFDNIGFGLKMRKTAPKDIDLQVRAMADFLKISHLLTRLPANLSGGERQRSALARALVLQPEVLLLDEPLSAVDRLTGNFLRDELKRIHRELGMTILHITHNMEEAFFLADRMAVMNQGKILQQGTVGEVCGQPKNRFVAELMGLKNFLPVRLRKNGIFEIEGMGTLDPGLLPTISRQTGKMVLTFPGQAVELAPRQSGDAYWWQGSARIVALHPGGEQTEFILALENGAILHTAFSQREIHRFSFVPTVGMKVAAAITIKDLYLLPD